MRLFALACCLLAASPALIGQLPFASAAPTRNNNQNKNLNELDYRVYPKRSAEEAAVLEWGHSAIISALDASVATFGPQTSDAALLEVECMPILASPLNGLSKSKRAVTKLDNADETHGNMVVMTNTGNLSGVQMARIAVNSGAAALLVVNMDEEHPDDIYRLAPGRDDEDEENDEDDEDDDDQWAELLTDIDKAADIDIPVCMISLNSANVLTTATVTPDMSQEDIVNNGMPDRVRLYAGGDRPFFEDVEPVDPTLYLIHNLMTDEECSALAKQAARTASDDKTAQLQLLLSHGDSSKMRMMESVVLWKGALATHADKQIEERIEQVTGFPATHYSDFTVYKLSSDSLWQPHYDFLANGQVPVATITVYLSNDDLEDGGRAAGPSIVYPSLENTDPVKIMPRKGMAIVHHNLDNQNQELDLATLSAWLPFSSFDGNDNVNAVYVARKYVFAAPPSNARRVVLPMVAAPFGGKLPSFFYRLHIWFVSKFGTEQGDLYFDKLCVFVPVLILLGAAQLVANYVRDSLTNNRSSSASAGSSSSSSKASKKTRTATSKSNDNTNNTNSNNKSAKKKKKN